MCTLVVLHKVHPQFDLLVAANRDELLARSSSAPSLHGDAVYGVDLERGGTWMGATRGGLFVGITNQRTLRGTDRTRRSRGAVVRAALESGTVSGVDAVLDSIDPREHNGFNLLYGDGETLRVAYARDDERLIERESLPAGLWILPNDRIGAPFFEWKTTRARDLVEPLVGSPWEILREALPRVLADHERAPPERVPELPPGAVVDRSFVRELTAICIRTPLYGTRSSTICAVAGASVVHYLFAPVAPCRGGTFEDLTPLFRR